jgi:PEP-CTERM motif
MHTARRFGQLASFATIACAMAGAHATTLTKGAQPTFIQDLAGGPSAYVSMVDGSYSQVYSNGGISQEGLLGNGGKPSAVSGAVNVFNIVKASLSPTNGADLVERQATLTNTRKTRSWLKVNGTATSVSLTDTGAVGMVSLQGTQEISTPYIDGTSDGGVLRLSNYVADAQSGVISANVDYRQRFTERDVDGFEIASILGPWTSLGLVPMWQASTITGSKLSTQTLGETADGWNAPQGWNVSARPGHVLGYEVRPYYAHGQYYTRSEEIRSADIYTLTGEITFGGLKLTDAGFDAMQVALGLGDDSPSELPSIGYDAFNAVNNRPDGWGSLTTTLKLETTLSVPEPSTYATMALGLMCLGVAVRRQRVQGAVVQ